jgi:hypothetical protein
MALFDHVIKNPQSDVANLLVLAHPWIGITHVRFFRWVLSEHNFSQQAENRIALTSAFINHLSINPEFEIWMNLNTRLRNLTSECSDPTMQAHLEALLVRLSQRSQPWSLPNFSQVFIPKISTYIKAPSKNLARELAVVESRLLSLLSFDQMYNHITRPGSSELISSVIELTNSVMHNLAFLILSTRSQKTRLDFIAKLIRIAQESFLLGNFSAVMSITGVLSYAPVSRLKDTMAALSTTTRATLNQLNELMSPVNNFAAYRAELQQRLEANKSVIPFFGILLKDFTIIEATVSNTFSVNCPSHLSLAKLTMIQKHLHLLDYTRNCAIRFLAQNSSCELVLPLCSTEYHSDDFLFDLSYSLEPPKGSQMLLNSNFALESLRPSPSTDSAPRSPRGAEASRFLSIFSKKKTEPDRGAMAASSAL